MKLNGTSVVITGASSGIGRATALTLARKGARLILAARRAEVLDELARECARNGGDAIAVPTDVTDPDAVAELAKRALTAYGRIDVWFNNAGGGAIGAYWDVPITHHRQTIELNLLGAMHGAAAAIPIFLRQGRGILINNISIGAFAPTPFASAYVASKFGLRGFTASLRQELAEHRGIHICGLFPAVVDTPGFAHGANMTGKTLDVGPLVYTPEQVADAVADLIRHPRDEMPVGWPTRAAQVAYSISPWLTEHMIGFLTWAALRRASPAPRTDGALLRPMAAGTTARGGWLERKGLPSARTLSRAGLVLSAIAALALMAAGREPRTLRPPRRRAASPANWRP